MKRVAAITLGAVLCATASQEASASSATWEAAAGRLTEAQFIAASCAIVFRVASVGAEKAGDADVALEYTGWHDDLIAPFDHETRLFLEKVYEQESPPMIDQMNNAETNGQTDFSHAILDCHRTLPENWATPSK